MELGQFSDLPSKLGFSPQPNKLTSEKFISILGKLPKFPTDFQIQRGQVIKHEGVEIRKISWSTGYGPRTEAFLLVPENFKSPLPGVLMFHSHDDIKEYGKEKIVDGAGELPIHDQWVRKEHYGNRAPANALARRGFAVLVFDCFMWGSRKIGPEFMPQKLKNVLQGNDFEKLAVMHESMSLAKYLSLFGSTLSGLLNFDDRVAFQVAKTLPEMTNSISVVGLSGGGCRALLLHATEPELNATVSIGAMATFESMLAEHVAVHSWMFFPQDIAAHTDWTGVAISGSPRNLYLQFCGKDQLFTLKGMKDADEIITKNYALGKYKSDFYPVPHTFSVEMQESAFDWLEKIQYEK